jgi:hypothetical protein
MFEDALTMLAGRLVRVDARIFLALHSGIDVHGFHPSPLDFFLTWPFPNPVHIAAHRFGWLPATACYRFAVQYHCEYSEKVRDINELPDESSGKHWR